MLKKLSMVLAATAVMGICMAMVPQKVKGDGIKGKWLGVVVFKMGHGHDPNPGSPNPWLLGLARHRKMPNGWITHELFWHLPGYEWAFPGLQPLGRSQGDARVIVGWNTCRKCADRKEYNVKTGWNLIRMTLKRNGPTWPW